MKEKEKNADEDEEKKQIKTKQMSKTHRPIPGNEERGLREDAVPAPYCYQLIAARSERCLEGVPSPEVQTPT